ncbi:SRPBCC family protein [Streptomyces sp. NPDC101225]|uniref:SRPBCC family protein n=1 Tax=Streptomyces sp. NPDC101225 TaxID=3366135 RepID=UPI00382D415F
MPARRMDGARHTVEVAAPAGVVYGLLADAPRWPVLLPHCLHAERMDFDGQREELRLWEYRRGRVSSLLARRVLRPGRRRIDFWLHPAPVAEQAPVAGSWSVRSAGQERCLLTLQQERPPGQAPGVLQVQVREELEAVRASAELWDRLDELLLAFEDGVEVAGPQELVYDFLYRIADWARTVPHVDAVEAVEDEPGVQQVVVHTVVPHTGRPVALEGVRLCFPAAGRIVHKQTVPSGLLAAYCGEWSLQPGARGLRAVCAHRVLLRPGAVEAVLGPGALPVDARRQVREWLGGAGTEVLGLARWHAESAVRRLR